MSKINPVFLLVTMSIPLTSPSEWKTLQFRKISPHRIEYTPQGLKVNVNNSAQPMIYPFQKSLSVTRFKADLSVDGKIKNEEATWEEDSVFRLGLVVKGEKTLSGPKKWIAAEWVRTLFELAPRGLGIDQIYFYNITQNKKALGLRRVHPSSDLIREEVIGVQLGKELEILHQLEKPLEVLALWLSLDGDNSHSTYQVLIKKLEIETL